MSIHLNDLLLSDVFVGVFLPSFSGQSLLPLGICRTPRPPVLLVQHRELCFLSVMSIVLKSPASASSASKPVYSQLIHFIAIR